MTPTEGQTTAEAKGADREFRPVFSTHGHARKTHLAIDDGDAVCGMQDRMPDAMWSGGEAMPLTPECVADYLDCDADGVCCARCAAVIRKATGAKTP